jgi:hypothetical protein
MPVNIHQNSHYRGFVETELPIDCRSGGEIISGRAIPVFQKEIGKLFYLSPLI